MTGFWSSHHIDDAHIGRVGFSSDNGEERGGDWTATLDCEVRSQDHVGVPGETSRDLRLKAISMLTDLARDHLADEADGRVIAAAVTDGSGKVILAAEMSLKTVWFDRDSNLD